MKMNLPVILLKGLVLLPNDDLTIEFEHQSTRNILDMAELFHNKRLLVVYSNDPLEPIPREGTLASVGILTEIVQRLELPNHKIRAKLKGLKRVRVYEYLNIEKKDETLESIVEELPLEQVNATEEAVMREKIIQEMKRYVESMPGVSDTILKTLKNKSLSDVTDIGALYLSLPLNRMELYLLNTSVTSRVTMLLEDIKEQREAIIIEQRLDEEVKEKLEQNQKDFILREKMRLIQEELESEMDELEDLKNKIAALNCPDKIKKRLEQEYRRLKEMQQMSPEANLVQTYIEWFLKLPWDVMTKDNELLEDVKEILDQSHAGLEKVKTRIIEFLAVRMKSGNLSSPIICLVGPPGVGKTTLAYSVSKAMHRKFVKFSVGGMSDDSEIMGHRRTYLGANPGRIISSIVKGGSKNPVFLIDEIDKMTKGIHGDPASSLLEVLDPVQNKYFVDRYLEEEFDLSNVMFMVTANNIDDIPVPLLDRLEMIELSGYTELEKLDIARNHLLPEVCKTHGIKQEKIQVSDNILLLLIRDYTREAGVRQLKRVLETIVRKIVTETVLEHKEKNIYKIDKKMVVSYLGKCKYPKVDSHSKSVGVVNGLAYTSYGGDTLAIEVNLFPGKGSLLLTGSLGDVMKESAQIALSYLKANYHYFHIPYTLFTDYDIHIHVPEGAIKKDGPSAGIALTTALLSALIKKKVPATLAMTGEITLRGKVLPIGGLKEKSIGAVRNGIKTILLPFDNKNDLDDVPKEVREKLDYYFVKHYRDVYHFIWNQKPDRTIVYNERSDEYV